MDKRFFSRGAPAVFSESALVIVGAAVSLFLQVISFFTTLDGARAYFEATFALAPLLFALAVQTVVYFLENSVGRRVTAPKAIALALAVMCSSYFSFVGIYNNINSPESYLERTYDGYCRTLNSALAEISDDTQRSAAAQVDAAVNAVVREYAALSSEMQALTELSAQLDETQAQTSYDMSAPRRADYKEYADYAAAYSAYIAALSQGTATEEQAGKSALLAAYGLADGAELAARLAELTSKLTLAEGTLGAQGSAFTAAAQLLRERIMSGDTAPAQGLFALYGTLCGGVGEVPAELNAAQTELTLPSYAEIAGALPAAVVRERLTGVISRACAEAAAAGAAVNAADFTFENIYTLPVYAVISGGMGADAAVSLALAVLVDGLSLVFALISARDRSVISAGSTNTAFAMCSDIFERGVATALRLGDGGSLSGGWDGERLAQRLGEFVALFEATDGAGQGYSLIAPKSALSGYEALVALLCQFSLAKPLTAKEAELLTDGARTEPCVLLKTKFLLWVGEKFCGRDKLAQPEESGVAHA